MSHPTGGGALTPEQANELSRLAGVWATRRTRRALVAHGCGALHETPLACGTWRGKQTESFTSICDPSLQEKTHEPPVRMPDCGCRKLVIEAPTYLTVKFKSDGGHHIYDERREDWHRGSYTRCLDCGYDAELKFFAVEENWRNFYQCPDCGEEWEDVWSSQVNDDCPCCGLREVEPYTSEEVER